MSRLLSQLSVGLLLGCGAKVADPGESSQTEATEATDDPEGAIAASSPGRVVLHRLNRAEYNNTVRDLLGTTLTPADAFPADDYGHGFDNIAGTLSMSPLHIEGYERAAGELMDWSLGVGMLPVLREQWFGVDESMNATIGQAAADYWMLPGAGDLTTTHTVSAAGPYTFSARAFGWQVGSEPVRMVLLVDGEEVLETDVVAVVGEPEVYSVELELDAGEHVFGVRYPGSAADPPVEDSLFVQWLALEGPYDVMGTPTGDPTRVIPCGVDEAPSAACVEEMVRTFAPRAWRRPVTDDEVARLTDLHALALDTGVHWHEAVSVVGQAMLLSPHFLFRVEADPAPGAGPRPLDDWELASRMSYFLWSSMPDAELFALAAEGALQDDDVVEAQVRRMLADDRALALVDNLAGQWLQVRVMDSVEPDPTQFPEFDDTLRASMQDQMWLQAADVLLADRSMLDLITATHGWSDGRLAPMLGVDLPADAPFQPVDLSHTLRRGMLGTPGLQTTLATPSRTSPVLRGKWVLTNLTCQPPPPPPAGVESFEEAAADDADLSMRELLEKHREDPSCASCHNAMDPIGLGMEHFNAIGADRDVDERGEPIDASGTLPSGESFDGLPELAAILATEHTVPGCMVDKTFTYALGRAPTDADVPYLEHIEARFIDADHRFADLAVGIVLSHPFRWRAEEAP